MEEERFLVVYILWFCDLIVIQPYRVESKYDFIVVKGRVSGKYTKGILFPNTPQEFLKIIGLDYNRDIEIHKVVEFGTREEFDLFSSNHEDLKNYRHDWENLKSTDYRHRKAGV